MLHHANLLKQLFAGLEHCRLPVSTPVSHCVTCRSPPTTPTPDHSRVRPGPRQPRPARDPRPDRLPRRRLLTRIRTSPGRAHTVGVSINRRVQYLPILDEHWQQAMDVQRGVCPTGLDAQSHSIHRGRAPRTGDRRILTAIGRALAAGKLTTRSIRPTRTSAWTSARDHRN